MQRTRIALAMVAVLLAAGSALADEPKPPDTPTPPPQAAPDEAAKKAAEQMFREADPLYAKGDYEGARAKLEAATKLDPTLPGPWRNLGLTYRVLKKCHESIDSYLMYLKLRPQSEYGDRVKKEIELCRKDLGEVTGDKIEGEAGGIAVRVSNAEGATVSIDGVKRGSAGEVLKTTVGSHQVLVERPGYLPKTETVEVLKGVTHDVVVTLEEDPNAPIELRMGTGGSKPVDVPNKSWVKISGPEGVQVLVNGTAVAPGHDGYVEVEPGIQLIEVTAPGKDPWRRRVVLIKGQKREMTVALVDTATREKGRKWGWVSLGGAAALLVAGTTFALLENGLSEDERDLVLFERARPPNTTNNLKTRADYDALESKRSRDALISNICYGGAAVALASSVYFFIKSRSEERPGLEPAFALSPTVAPDGAIGVAVSRSVKF